MPISINLLNNWKAIVEITILWIVFYQIMLFFKGTRAIQVLRGLIVLVFAFFIFQILRLETLDWLMTHFFAISVIGILVIFQPEIRQGLAKLGQQKIFKGALYEEELKEIIAQIVCAVDILSRKKTGALIAIEKEDSLKEYIESGVKIDSRISAELIQTIFTPNSLLHDGGLIIQNTRIIAAGCLFPLTEKPNLDRILGTRHRAAIGLAEQTDAIVVVASEETGDISLCYNGKLFRDLDLEQLSEKLKSNFKNRKNK
ncbi:MAG: diadenylate cyclase CdaA [Candidatus Omnitrophota bacterium]